MSIDQPLATQRSFLSAHHIMAWLSPGFPVGAFSYSHGLEYAISTNRIQNGSDLNAWLQVILRKGAGFQDAVLLAQAYRGEDVAALAEALVGSKERHLETMQMGTAFAKIVSELLDYTFAPAPLPVVMGQAAQRADIALCELLPLYLHAFASNLISVGVRLIPIGQKEGQKLLYSLFALLDALAHKAQKTGLDDLGTAAMRADMASMQHETMTIRIFRT